MINAIYANTWEGLTFRMLGYYHDHCRHFYTGLTADLPSEYKEFKTTDKYVFLYKEDEPYKPNKHDS